MTTCTRLLIASNRLPFTVQSDGETIDLRPTSGGLASALATVHRADDNVWIGWPGDCSRLTAEQRCALDLRLRGERVVAVDLCGGEIEAYYDGVCNSVLWPVFHYLLDRVPLALPEFDAYRAVNERFAEAIVETYQPGDIVWVHDYHLLLAPAMIRSRIPDARIGFFLHTPFPAGDVFRILPWRRELLEGMLGSTLVGFQTERDASNFAGAVRMLTELTVEASSVVAGDREIKFGAYPIGVDPLRFQDVAQPVERCPAWLEAAGGERKLLVGIDRLDYTKGIPRRLTAYERLLEERPDLRGAVELVQVAVPSRSEVPAYVEFKAEVDALVQRVNARFGTADWIPVRYIAQPISVPVLAALYRAADVMLVTSLRDGMNLVAKEFVSARSDEDGVLILSEMAGAAEELFDALMVNPYSIDQLAGAMARALALDRDERRHRMRCMRQRVNDWTVERWVREFTFDVDGAATPVESTVERLAGTIRALVPEGLAAAREGLAAARGRTRGGRMLAGAAVHRLRQATN